MTVKAYILVNVSTGTEDEVCKALVEFDEVEEVATIYGEYDAIIKVAAKDMKDLDAVEVAAQHLHDVDHDNRKGAQVTGVPS